jgi:hypothetical protein
LTRGKGERTTWEAGRIKDARGRAVTQLDPVMMHLKRRHGAIPAEPLAQIARRVGIGMTRGNQVALWAGVICTVCVGIALGIGIVKLTHGTMGAGRFARSLIPLSGIWLPLYAFWMGTRGVRFRRITGAMLQHRRCPHCGYDLRGLQPAADDGATVCPECGSAWTLPAGGGAEP